MSWFTTLFKKNTTATSKGVTAPLFFTNTLSGKKEVFTPLRPGVATLYSCGPTVYSRAHIGNLRAYVFSDTLARTLMNAGFHVKRVINITDVGHLVADAEQGEDKMAVAARREHKKPEEIARQYAGDFVHDLAELNIDTDNILFPHATEYIREQIALAKTLEEKGFAYQIADGLYFDTAKFSGYGKLGGLSGAELEAGKRVAVAGGKRHPADFALWRAAKLGDLQQWDSPWGKGNPGWHIECSAMSRALLGQEIDIHTGGEDLAHIHHNNEIAQSEAANGRQFVRYWMHTAFLNMEGEKISKSLKNDVYLSDIIERGIHPLALRYFFLQAHYRTPLSFSWTSLIAASGALTRLWNLARQIKEEAAGKSEKSECRTRFVAAVRDDLATPQALGILWESLRSEEYAPEEKWGLLEDADELLGLSLVTPPPGVETAPIPADIEALRAEREKARRAKDFTLADELRQKLESKGYEVRDDADGSTVLPRI